MELLKKGCSELNIDLSTEAEKRFAVYQKRLVEWNERMNLTAITEPDEIQTKHFLDSLTPVSAGLIPQGCRVVDVGCGAGFPGLPIRFVCEEIRLTLLDSLEKRLQFLRQVLEDVKIKDVAVVHARAEDGGRDPKYREKFDVALSRAVANLATLAEYCLPFVRVGGHLLALKGPLVEQELKMGKKAIEVLGGKVQDVIGTRIPRTELAHNIVVIKKVSPCPKSYPRKAGTPSKKPIG